MKLLFYWPNRLKRLDWDISKKLVQMIRSLWLKLWMSSRSRTAPVTLTSIAIVLKSEIAEGLI